MKHLLNKTRKPTIIVLLAMFSFSFVEAQLTVDDIGRTQVGPTNDASMSDNDKDNITSLQVFGKGTYNTGGLISIGDIGRKAQSGFNVTLGEYGGSGNDSDILWLHGKKGLYFTAYGSGSNTIAYYDLNAGNAFRFNCPVYANNVLLTSDERYKSNIEGINSSLSKLGQLKGVQYNLQANPAQMETIKRELNAEPKTEKEKADKAFFEALEKKLTEKQNKKHLGFVAQDMQKVFPELVSEDENGYLAVDYIGLIPVLVEGLKELQGIVSEQNTRIEALEKAVGVSERNLSVKSAVAPTTGNELLNGSEEYLSQNVPNPVDGSAQISYFLPKGATNASISFYNVGGALVRTVPLAVNEGKGQITISSADFATGVHVYTLTVNDMVLDTKKMMNQ